MKQKHELKCFFVISRYNEDVSWIKKYTTKYVVYNKGPALPGFKTRKLPNIGANQYDIFHFIYNNYYHLPELMAFIQGNPFDHCKKEYFDKLIFKETFTALEFYGYMPANSYEKRDYDGGFLEINNSWYIAAHNNTHKQTCRYTSLDQFMNLWFKNYNHIDWIRFSPGSQYLIEKKQALHYPRSFWKRLMDELTKFSPTEGYVIERALWMIFQCNLEPKEVVYKKLKVENYMPPLEFDGSFYDADYYERGKKSGKGWLENYHWMPRRSFREAFAYVDALGLDEKSYVLDFGCAKGFIVTALRGLGIKADGCDISTYALSYAPESCWNCTEDRAWEEHKSVYTHIVCKDVLEHLNVEQLHKTLKRFSLVAPMVMCVIPMGDNGVYRIKEYHTEISHLIIENEAWWKKLFKDAGWTVKMDTNHVPGLKDNWMHVPNGNRVFILERKTGKMPRLWPLKQAKDR